MKTCTHQISVLLALLSTFVIPALNSRAQDTAFTYQGRVTDNGTNYTGGGQFKFALVTSTNISSTAAATANLSGPFVVSYNVTSGGNGYVTAPAVLISGGGGSGATAHAVVGGGVVTSVEPDTAGSGYTSTPTVTIAPPPPDIAYTTYWSNDGTSADGSEPAAAVNVGVGNGLFMVVLGDTNLPDMMAMDASIFTRPDLELRIWFNDGVNGFAALDPAQKLTPAPYAIAAGSANSLLGTLPASQLTGTLPAGQLGGTYSGAVTFNNGGNSFSGAFSGDGGGVTNVSANSLVLMTTNVSVTSWGLNQYGERTIPANLGQVVAVAAGVAHSLALRADGTVAAWGAGETNNPGNGLDFGQSIVPVGLSNVVAVSAGYLHNLALQSNGTVVAWGAGLTNDAGYGVNFGQSIVPAGLSNVVAVSAGAFHSLALKANGTVAAWGAGLTNNPTDYVDFGQSIVPAGLSNVMAISAGIYHSLALQTNGTLVAWGDNEYGQTNIPSGLSNVIAVAAGGVHNLALKMGGTVVAWGAGTSNNPTDGINFGQSMIPAGLSNVVAIVAGYIHSVALRSDGTVVAWGAGETNDLSIFGEDGQSIVPDGLNNVVALGPGSVALHTIVLRKQSEAPVAWLNSDNTFNGNIRVNGDVNVSGEIMAGGDLRLNDANLWLRGGNDQNNGLGWYLAGTKNFTGSFFSGPDGPVLFGAGGGALGTSGTNGQQVALVWDSSQHVGIGTTAPSAPLDFGNYPDGTKLRLGGYGIGQTNSQLLFHLGGNYGSFSFQDAPGGNEWVNIQRNGLSSQSLVLVHGQVWVGNSAQYKVPGTSEGSPLRILRGHIAASGSITTGEGFTVTKTGTGAYTVTFTTPFSSEPTITATPQVGLARIATCTNVGTGSAQIRTFDVTGSSAVAIDQDFHFIAIGPQ